MLALLKGSLVLFLWYIPRDASA